MIWFFGSGIIVITIVLGLSSPAEAIISAFESTIDDNEYLGTLDFTEEGTGLSPLFT